MRLVSFQRQHDSRGESGIHVGALTKDSQSVVDLLRAAQRRGGNGEECFGSMRAFLQHWPRSREVARQLLNEVEEIPHDDSGLVRTTDQIRWLAPVPVPNSIRDCMVYEAHLANCIRSVAAGRFPPVGWLDRAVHTALGIRLLRPPRVWYDRPIYYKGNRCSVVGHEADVIWPSYSQRLDYELEFGAFISKQGRDVAVDNALEMVAGYSLFNDFTARDTQLAELKGHLGPSKGKDFDTGNAIGPYLVTADELGDPAGLILSARVNGEEWSRARAAEMHFTLAEIIAFISRDETLYPGDFIAAGTLPGGCGLELNRWLKPGDVVELDGGPLGVLRNRIVKCRLQ